MKDQLLLLLTGCVCAVGAAWFWRLSGMLGVLLLLLLSNLSLLIDNRQLRRRLRERDAPPTDPNAHR